MRITVPSLDVGTYFFQNPSATPNTASSTPSIDDLETTYWTNPVVHKGVNLKANRIVGEGFDILPSEHPDAVPGIAKEAADRCAEFYEKIGGLSFSLQSTINTLVAGNEWTEMVYNQLEPKSLVYCAHGDFRTIDFRRNFINNKILFDEHGEPLAYWQYIDDLSQLYHTLSIFYGDIEPYENMLAAKSRLMDTQHRIIKDGNGNEIGVSMVKPNYMFIKKEEIVHLSFNNLNDNFYGTSMLIPAWNALTHLQQVMYATAEAINDMGYPKPVVSVGDEKNPPTDNMNTLAQSAVQDPLRKESFVLPYYCKISYLQPAGMGSGNIGDYPQWFVTAVAMGLRIPRELLTGEGEANRATAVQAGTDFDIDVQGARRRLVKYHLDIFNYYLNTHGYATNQSGNRSIYLPKIAYPQAITEDQMMKRKMALDLYQGGLMKFGEARKELDLPEDEDEKKNDSYVGDIKAAGAQVPVGMPMQSPVSMQPDELQQPQVEQQPPIPEGEQQAVVTAQHRLMPREKLDAKLNKEFRTDGVNYFQIGQNNVGTKIVSVSELAAKKIRDTIMNMEAQGKSADDIFQAIKKIGDYSDFQAHMVFETEQANLVESARLASETNKGARFKKWVSVNDEKTSNLCRALHGKRIPIEDEFEVSYKDESGKAMHWKGQNAPAHPQCRSHIEYSNVARFAKEKIYLENGMKAPEGVNVYIGRDGGKYYIGEPRAAAPPPAPAQKPTPPPSGKPTSEPPPRKTSLKTKPVGEPPDKEPDRKKLPSSMPGIPAAVSDEEIAGMENSLKRRLREEYGESKTDNIKEVGFVLSDGAMPKMGMDGTRGDDHRIAANALPKKYKMTAAGADMSYGEQTVNMQRFMFLTGAIRAQFSDDSTGLNFLKPPTPVQMSTLKSLFASGKAKLPIYMDYDLLDHHVQAPTDSKEIETFEKFEKEVAYLSQVADEDIAKPQEVKRIVEKLMRHSPNQGEQYDFKDEREAKMVLDKGHYCLISAGRNPNSPIDAKMTIDELKARSEHLKNDLIAKGYMFTPVVGKYGEVEDSFLVMAHDPDENDMVELAKRYNQESVIIVKEGKNRLIYTSGDKIGRKVLGVGWAPVGNEQTDFYTVMKTRDGKELKFNVGLDFPKGKGG